MKAHDPDNDKANGNDKTKDCEIEDTARLTSPEDKDTPETFLTVEPGETPFLSNTSLGRIGVNHPMEFMQHASSDRDLFCNKSYYSAFKDGSLVQTLRGRFVTEIYICGILTNISVYATAMDAARHVRMIRFLILHFSSRCLDMHALAFGRNTSFCPGNILS